MRFSFQLSERLTFPLTSFSVTSQENVGLAFLSSNLVFFKSIMGYL